MFSLGGSVGPRDSAKDDESGFQSGKLSTVLSGSLPFSSRISVTLTS